MAKEINFEIEHKAGICSEVPDLKEKVMVYFEYDPGCDDGELERHIQKSLEEWFSGANVKLLK